MKIHWPKVVATTPSWDEEVKEKIKEVAALAKRGDIMAFPGLRRIAEWMHKKEADYRTRARNCYQKLIQGRMQQKGGKGLKEVVARIASRESQPISYLERDKECPKGQNVGTVTTDPGEIDGMIKHGHG